jgi:hypothetical protein
MNVANRVTTIYSTIDPTTNTVIGTRAKTTVSNDTTSQGLYGIIQKVLSVGGATAVTAAQIQSTYLKENAYPETSRSLNLGTDSGNNSGVTVTIDCLGYYHWLNLYAYNQTVVTGTINASDKIIAIINAQLNSIITDTTNILSNTVQVTAFENDDYTAYNILQEAVSMGDASDNRWVFGVYQNRKAFYNQMSSTVDYILHLMDSSQKVETPIGAEIYPWNILPGKWLMFPDFLIGRTSETNPRYDPRCMFIEDVTYTMPWGLALNGGKTATLAQKLAKLGLAGVGA